MILINKSRIDIPKSEITLAGASVISQHVEAYIKTQDGEMLFFQKIKYSEHWPEVREKRHARSGQQELDYIQKRYL